MKKPKKIRYAIQYLLIKGLIRLIQAMPYRLATAMGRCMGLLIWGLDPLHRRIANVQMRATLGKAYHWSLSLKMFMHIGMIPVDMIKALYTDDAELFKRFEIHGMENIQAALSSGRGVMCISAHMGNWEVLGHIFKLLGRDFHILMDIRNDPHMDSIIKEMRGRLPGVVIEPPRGGMVPRIAGLLRQGHCAGVMIDLRGKQGIMLVCDVLGLPAPTSPAPALIAIKGEALIVPVYALKKGATYAIYFEKALDARDYGRPEDVPDQLTECWRSEPIVRLSTYMQDWLTSIVNAHPTQWIWLYSRWARRSDMRRLIREGQDFKTYVLAQAQRLEREALPATAEGS
jgi:KDO2-lipid IV(A) lauroyltransferase